MLLIDSPVSVVQNEPVARQDGNAIRTLGEGPAADANTSQVREHGQPEVALNDPLSVGVVTPHNTQRGMLGIRFSSLAPLFYFQTIISCLS